MNMTERISNALHTQTFDPNSDPTPQGVENRNIILWLKCVLTALHVNCMILFDKVL
jgi:hypothetical protein